ncbi:MAG: KH domain-containing protein [Clostridiales bacterium]|nr:KH domain-containing protein [Clostridiales bacterium]
MLELIKYVINRFAEKTDEIEYDVVENGKNVSVTVTLSESDMGKVIGRQGKIAKALRTLVRAGSMKEGKKYNIEIVERGENK